MDFSRDFTTMQAITIKPESGPRILAEIVKPRRIPDNMTEGEISILASWKIELAEMRSFILIPAFNSSIRSVKIIRMLIARTNISTLITRLWDLTM